MKKALVCYWHGLGDVIMLTPHLRHLYKQGYIVELMCRAEVRESKLLDECPYVGKLIEIPNPWQSPKYGFTGQMNRNLAHFQELRGDYDWSGASPHRLHKRIRGIHKIDMTSRELGIELEDKRLEVFIPKSIESWMDPEINGDYIFVHRFCRWHPYHTWEPDEWIDKNLPPLKRIYTDENGKTKKYGNINTVFMLAKRARHRVLASSVLAVACDAMGCVIDAINYGHPDRKVWPLDQSQVLHIREKGIWIR